MIDHVMETDENQNSEQLELTADDLEQAAKDEAKRDQLLKAVSSCQLNTIEERVAWVLNHFPKTRDSDIALQVRYWQNFQSKQFNGGDISVTNYFRLAKLTTLTRARAIIQNQLKIFQASDEVKKRRKQLQDKERDNALRKRATYHQHAVYIDESGKTQDNLIVGSMWFLNGPETIKFYRVVDEWRKARNFAGEFHFQSITEAKLVNYMEFADLVAANSALICFKVISVPRRGVANVRDALLKLTYHLLVRGIEHEHSTGRAVLPRGIQVCKDAEELGQDKIFIAELSDRMKQAAATQFRDELYIGDFLAEESSQNMHLQIADLFASSVSRRLNTGGDGEQPKDRFAQYFLEKVGHGGAGSEEPVGDMMAHMVL